MSHCISIYLINKKEIRDHKIGEVLLDYESQKINWVELGSNLLATTYIPKIREFGVDKTIAKITTDYFGGFGEQTARLFINNEEVMDLDDSCPNPINTVLREMGVIKSTFKDEFDTIGLGNFRSNSDFEK
jgi:hypothetical protein